MIVVKVLSVQSGTFRLADVSFEIPTGRYGVLMGRTGSGKTTLLEAIAGLKPVQSGQILLGGVDVTHLKPAERNIGYVPQDGALFSTMTVRDHLAFSLEIRRVGRSEIKTRVAELARLLEIEHLLHRRTPGLSGGERQRVALGRALAFRPGTLLLDEPLSALDEATREQMYELLEHVQHHTGVTTLHVTHNLDEAQRLADHVLRIDKGQLRLSGPSHGKLMQGPESQGLTAVSPQTASSGGNGGTSRYGAPGASESAAGPGSTGQQENRTL